MGGTSLDGCGKFIKYAMFIVNFLILIAGLAILGLGIWVLTDTPSLDKFAGDGFDKKIYVGAAAILLTFGGIVAFISFLGCCGAIKEVKCLLLTFFIIQLLITIMVIVGVVFAFKIKGSVEDAFKEGFRETMKDMSPDNGLEEAWNNIQKEVHCCGTDGFNDWASVALKEVPDSCNCNPESDSDCIPLSKDRYVWSKGCGLKLRELIEKHMKTLGIVGVVTMVVIILSMVFSCSLFLMIKK